MREWNSLPKVVRESTNIDQCKRGILVRPIVEKQYYDELSRKEEKIVNQLWTRNSNLNAYRYKIGQAESLCCTWCLVPETNHQYFFFILILIQKRGKSINKGT